MERRRMEVVLKRSGVRRERDLVQFSMLDDVSICWLLSSLSVVLDGGRLWWGRWRGRISVRGK